MINHILHLCALLMVVSSVAVASPPSPFDQFRVLADPHYHIIRGERPKGPAVIFSAVVDKPYDVKHYNLALNFPEPDNFFEGVAEITVESLRRINQISFDFVGMVVDAVYLGDTTLGFLRNENILTVGLPDFVDSGEELKIKIVYHGTPDSGMHISDGTNGYFSIFTLVEPEGARYWFPCFDAPSDKALSDLTITVPAPLTAVSNGALISSSQSLIPDIHTLHWRESHPIATYLISVTIADYIVVEDEWNGMPLQYFVVDEDREKATKTFGRTAQMLEFFSKSIAPYPFIDEKYAIVVIPGGGGAMEHTTATTFGRGLLDLSYGEAVAVHELAHHWWGDDLTLTDWNHLWLNEGFASYFDVLWYESIEVSSKLLERMEKYRRDYLFESRENNVPIVNSKNSDYNSLFNAITYEKGAWVLHMLRRHLGDDLFWKGIQDYEKAYRYGGVLTDDLQNIMERVSGKNLYQFFRQWIYTAGHPRLDVDFEYIRAEKTGVFNVTQIQDGDAYEVDLPVRVKIGGKWQEMALPILEKNQNMYVSLESEPEIIRFDPENWVLKELTFRQPEVRWITQLAESEDWYGRMDAARGLGVSGSEEGFQALLSRFQDLNEHQLVREAAAEALGKRGDSRAFQPLADSLGQKEYWVRVAAIAGLSYLMDERAIPLMADILRDDESAWMRMAAARGLLPFKKNPVARAALEHAAEKDESREVRALARKILDS